MSTTLQATAHIIIEDAYAVDSWNYFADASEVGWPPGYFPQAVQLVKRDGTVCGLLDRRRPNGVYSVLYSGDGFTFRVYND